jgi:L-alanine-DL-glutamate epimerase-like enolase superfamily enzyme
MRLNAIDVLYSRNMAVQKKGKDKLPLPDYGYSTVIQVHAEHGGQSYSGLGEIRALPSITGESPKSAYKLACRLATRIRGNNIDYGTGHEPLFALADMLELELKSLFGIDPKAPLPQGFGQSVLYGFECALLDLLARISGKSVAELYGCTSKPVIQDVRARSVRSLNRFLNSLIRYKGPQGWLRSRLAGDAANAGVVMSAVAATLKGREHSIKGIWLDINGGWDKDSVGDLIRILRSNPIIGEAGVDLIIEDPFPGYATAHYRHALDAVIETQNHGGGRVRLMVGDAVWGRDSLRSIEKLLPFVDLKITPQKAGGFAEVLRMENLAREMGFSGEIYLGNTMKNTPLNTAALVALAQILESPVHLSAGIAPSEKVRMFAGGVRNYEEGGNQYLALDGKEGWAARICRSGLKHRVKASKFIRTSEVTLAGKEALLELLYLNAVDGSTEMPEGSTPDLQVDRKRRKAA